MSAPPLPDIFGNYILGDFVEVVSPENVSWLPQTVGVGVAGRSTAGPDASLRLETTALLVPQSLSPRSRRANSANCRNRRTGILADGAE